MYLLCLLSQALSGVDIQVPGMSLPLTQEKKMVDQRTVLARRLMGNGQR